MRGRSPLASLERASPYPPRHHEWGGRSDWARSGLGWRRSALEPFLSRFSAVSLALDPLKARHEPPKWRQARSSASRRAYADEHNPGQLDKSNNRNATAWHGWLDAHRGGSSRPNYYTQRLTSTYPPRLPETCNYQKCDVGDGCVEHQRGRQQAICCARFGEPAGRRGSRGADSKAIRLSERRVGRNSDPSCWEVVNHPRTIF